MKKLSLLILLIAGFTFTTAQEGTNWLKLGAHAGIPLGDAGDVSSFMAGIDGKYQFLTYDHFGFGVSTGYSHYFAEDGFDDFGVVPLAALLRYYPTTNFFFGGDIGYGLLTGGADDGGFYIRPEIGYHNENWNIYGFYQTVSGTPSPSAIGLGVNFNILQRAPQL